MHIQFDHGKSVDTNPRHRFRAWQDFVEELFAGLQACTERDGGSDFRVRLDLRDVRGVRIGRIGGSRHAVLRPSDKARRCDEIGLLLQTQGRTRLEVGSHALQLQQGEAALFDNAQPYRFDLADGFEHRLLLIDRDRLGIGRVAIEAWRGRVLPPSALPTRLLLQALTTITDGDEAHWSAPVLESLPLALSDWLETACGAAVAGTTPDSRSQRLLRSVLSDARHRLADPDLSPAVLAAAHGIAERTLHKLFATQGLTVMGWVREQRLLAVDQALRTAYVGAKIESIAREYGFNDPAAFRRAYRRRFGRSPGATRA